MPGPWQFQMRDGGLFRKCDFCDTFLLVDPKTYEFIEPHECDWIKEMRMRQAGRMALDVLKMVEWTNAIDGGTICPWCGGRRLDGHRPDCVRQSVFTKATVGAG